jgi:hypothetical protein
VPVAQNLEDQEDQEDQVDQVDQVVLMVQVVQVDQEVQAVQNLLAMDEALLLEERQHKEHFLPLLIQYQGKLD